MPGEGLPEHEVGRLLAAEIERQLARIDGSKTGLGVSERAVTALGAYVMEYRQDILATLRAADERRTLLDSLAGWVERLRALSARATAGDWYHYDEVIRPQFGQRRITEIQVRRTGKSIVAWSGFDGLPTVTAKKRNANAAFIVAAVGEIRRQLRFFDRAVLATPPRDRAAGEARS